ncbi:hypothetical protein F4818DRAFT_422216 [Hypoxylon cercidicola]|nr:hypothetical protein F4818DRAFT_422216 [Hypoxylon cercidicola]
MCLLKRFNPRHEPIPRASVATLLLAYPLAGHIYMTILSSTSRSGLRASSSHPVSMMLVALACRMYAVASVARGGESRRSFRRFVGS